MFDRDTFIETCCTNLDHPNAQRHARELVAEAVHDPAAILRSLGTPETAMSQTLYRSPTLTILNLVWGAHVATTPHNHNMWAVIGIYGGGEDNIFWRRTPGTPHIQAAGARSLRTGDVETLGHDIIHSVINPLNRLTGAIHIYGGDFFAAERSEWEPETLSETEFDLKAARARFENQSGRWI